MLSVAAAFRSSFMEAKATGKDEKEKETADESRDTFEHKPLRRGKSLQPTTTIPGKKPPTSPSPHILPWSELKVKDAIYKTNLKRVRYRSSFAHLVNDDIAYKEWETIKVKQMKAGTIEKLVEHLTSAEAAESDPNFFLAFLCTYKSFTSPLRLAQLLLDRCRRLERKSSFNNLPDDSDAIMRRVCLVISRWLEQYPRDFDDPPSFETLSIILNFAKLHSDLTPWKDIWQRCEQKHTRLSVSPFDDEQPFKFKFCMCETIIGCTCARPRSFSKGMAIDQYVLGASATSIDTFSPAQIAEQLTLVDAELFLRVIPRECLGCFWSRRDKKGDSAATIRRTIDHFNAVSLRVVSTVLDAVDTKSQFPSALTRSKAMEVWINAAQECREVKNFSSLKAILSGLQSASVFRLKRTWDLLKKDSLLLYEELSEIFSDDSNSKASRDLLIQEGTAKYAYSSGSTLKKKSFAKRQSWMKEGVVHGTVPYLGTFLTDLMMIDTALPDEIEDGLINFEKRRKEFEIVVQIKLLQQAAKNYKIDADQKFFQWFNSVPTYTEKEAYRKSLEVEPSKQRSTPEPERKGFTLRRYLSESDVFGKSNSLSSSISMLSLGNIGTLKPTPQDVVAALDQRDSLKPDDDVKLDENGVIVRAYLEGKDDVVYKSIKVLPYHRAIDVINTALIKFKSQEDPHDFSLFQVLLNKKNLHIPLHSNLYYACSKGRDMTFLLSKRKTPKKKLRPTGPRADIVGGVEGTFKFVSSQQTEAMDTSL